MRKDCAKAVFGVLIAAGKTVGLPTTNAATGYRPVDKTSLLYAPMPGFIPGLFHSQTNQLIPVVNQVFHSFHMTNNKQRQVFINLNLITS